MIRTRFAPSPNGPLHLGHAFSAIVSHDRARSSGGEFLVRIEDIDGARSRQEFVDQALEDLAWLGLEWDAVPVRQSARLAAYADAEQRLRAMGLLYPCRCTRAEIATAATEQGPDGPIYPGTCKHRDIDPAGAAWRLDVNAAMAQVGPLEWVDEIAGSQTARPDRFGDVVLVRKDDPASYHLAVTLDDAADGITVVTRGRDLFEASHVHRLLQALLDLPVPVWHHHPLLVEPDARGNRVKLAKRRGSPSLADRRKSGEDGIALATALRDRRLPAGISLE
ncbi:MAG: tRNA glutamyl-Q(34) synthetase GluQRS [Novosphingobium sp.]|nr:tRNA glutamyl-Q(34) synthetase GluQRS [Novosphingobium sp.]